MKDRNTKKTGGDVRAKCPSPLSQKGTREGWRVCYQSAPKGALRKNEVRISRRSAILSEKHRKISPRYKTTKIMERKENISIKFSQGKRGKTETDSAGKTLNRRKLETTKKESPWTRRALKGTYWREEGVARIRRKVRGEVQKS